MENKTSLIKSTAWYTAGNIFIRSISFLLLPLYSNLLTTEEFGIYALIMSFYAIAAVLYQGGMLAALSKFYLQVNKSDERKIVFSTILNSVIAAGLVLTLLIYMFAPVLSLIVLGSPNFSNLMLLISLTLLVETCGYYILHLLKTWEHSRKVVKYSATGAIANLLLNVFLVYFLRYGVEGIILAQLISSVLLLVVLLPVIKNNYSLKIDYKVLKAVLLFSFPLIIAGLFSSAVDVSDRFILNFFLGKKEVGIYSLSYRIATAMNLFVISFRTAWIPYSFNLYNKKDYKTSFGTTLNKLVAASIFVLLLISLLTRYFFDFKLFDFYLFNKEYAGGLIILPYVLAGYMLNGLASFYSVYPFVSGKSYHFLISDALSFIVNLILNFILIPVWGLTGAALATMLGFAASASYLFIISSKSIKIAYSIRELAVIILTGLVLLLAGLSFENIIFDIGLLIIFVIVVLFTLRLKLSNIFRFVP